MSKRKDKNILKHTFDPPIEIKPGETVEFQVPLTDEQSKRLEGIELVGKPKTVWLGYAVDRDDPVSIKKIYRLLVNFIKNGKFYI